jgi:hypothetical protein
MATLSGLIASEVELHCWTSAGTRSDDEVQALAIGRWY